ISITTSGTATWMLGDAPEGLAEQVNGTGGLWIPGGLDPLAELVRVHRLAVAVAASRGLDPDQPRHLTRSVILAPSPPPPPPPRPLRRRFEGDARPPVPPGALAPRAAAARPAVAAFNVITLEHVEAVVAGAEAAQASVVLQVSENAVKFRHGRLLPLARAAVA